MFKYSDLNYDDFYSSQHCKDENAEIKAILDSVCCDNDTVLDLGAGTGLVASMLSDRCVVWQVEKDPGMKAQNPYPYFINEDAFDYLYDLVSNGLHHDHVVSLFALDYMRYGTLTLAVKAANKECVFVVYDRPYEKGSNSYYAGQKLKFLSKCWLKMKSIDNEVEKLVRIGYRVTMHNLNGEPYYKVIVVGK